MWRVVCNVGTFCQTGGRVFESGAEAKAYCKHLSKHYKNYDIYKNNELVGTGDRYGYYPVRKRSKILTGSIGYSELMSERK